MLRRIPQTSALLFSLVLMPSAIYFGLAQHSQVDTSQPDARPDDRMPWQHVSFEAGSRPEARPCSACHGASDIALQNPNHLLNQRAGLSQQAWTDALQLEAKCGSCHRVPAPDDLTPRRWGDAVMNFMSKVAYYRKQGPTFEPIPEGLPYNQWMHGAGPQWLDVAHYYFTFSPETLETLPALPRSGLPFTAQPLGAAPEPSVLSQIGNVNIVDLDQDGRLDVLVCDFSRHAVTWIQQEADVWVERPLAYVPYPGHTETGDFDGDGDLDIIVADVGSERPTDNRVGRVVLLANSGQMRFETRILLQDVGRVSDVRPGDFDQDGDIDFVVAVFGFLKAGEIGWLEQQADGAFAYHRLSEKSGGVHVPTTDLNGDGRLDFIALIAQEHEEVAAFINKGTGRFAEHLLFKADSPTFGSSGIELTDLDQDGDTDILYTNGDAFDLSTPMIRPYHGVQWLENQGDFQFAYHDLLRLYGAYRAVPADLDDDGDLDVVATSLLNDWSDPARMSLVWLENDGQQQFTPHGIGNAPTSLITADVADLDENGRLEIVTGSMHLYPSDPRRGRVTLWTPDVP